MHASRILTCALVAASALFASACHTTESAPSSGATAVMPGKVSDLAAFESFIAGKPTPEQFRMRYPDVHLVLPGEIATKEFRSDNSRYFARLDAEGRIAGGKFM